MPTDAATICFPRNERAPIGCLARAFGGAPLRFFFFFLGGCGRKSCSCPPWSCFIIPCIAPVHTIRGAHPAELHTRPGEGVRGARGTWDVREPRRSDGGGGGGGSASRCTRSRRVGRDWVRATLARDSARQGQKTRGCIGQVGRW